MQQRCAGFGWKQVRLGAMRTKAIWLTKPDVECLTTFLTRPYVELDLRTLAQILEVHLRRQSRAMEKNIIAAIVGNDKAKTLVFHYFLDCPIHGAESSL